MTSKRKMNLLLVYIAHHIPLCSIWYSITMILKSCVTNLLVMQKYFQTDENVLWTLVIYKKDALNFLSPSSKNHNISAPNPCHLLQWPVEWSGGCWGGGDVRGLVRTGERWLWRLLEDWLEDHLVWCFPNAFHVCFSSFC